MGAGMGRNLQAPSPRLMRYLRLGARVENLDFSAILAHHVFPSTPAMRARYGEGRLQICVSTRRPEIHD